MPTVELQGLTKTFDDTTALTSVDLHIESGEFFGLLGPSGSGKTTLVRLIAGLDEPSEGRVVIDGVDATGMSPTKRGASVVFPSGALFPHLTARENMAFPMEMQKETPAEIERRVTDVAEALSLTRQLLRRPAEMSAGHRHGVATGRAIAAGRALLLMDEPLANLDATLRRRLRTELRELKAAEGATIVYATNDQAETMSLADRMAILDRGMVQQVGTPLRLYDHPDTLFVAGFLGSPPMNFGRAAVVAEGDGAALWLGSRRIVLDPAELQRRPGLRTHLGGEVIVGVRPHQLRYGGTGTVAGEQRIGGEVVQVEFLGADSLVHFTNDTVAVTGEAGTEFRAVVSTDVSLRVGDHIALAVDVPHLHYFDPDDGTTIRS